MQRRENGKPLRDAIRLKGLSIPRLATATRTVDPGGYGISPSTVGALVSTGSSGRENCSQRVAELIAAALDEPLQHLFEEPAEDRPLTTPTEVPSVFASQR